MFAGHGGPFMGPPGRWWDDEGTAQQLGITADQRKKMDDIFSTNRPGLIDDVAAVQKAEAVLEPLFAADAPSEGAILAQIGKVAEARAELEKAHARMLLALRAQLTHDQWMKLQAMRPARHEGEGGWRGKGGRMDPDGPGGDTQGPPPGGKP
jgi:Spy/CpxP family protein refolding chaperone